MRIFKFLGFFGFKKFKKSEEHVENAHTNLNENVVLSNYITSLDENIENAHTNLDENVESLKHINLDENVVLSNYITSLDENVESLKHINLDENVKSLKHTSLDESLQLPEKNNVKSEHTLSSKNEQYNGETIKTIFSFVYQQIDEFKQKNKELLPHLHQYLQIYLRIYDLKNQKNVEYQYKIKYKHDQAENNPPINNLQTQCSQLDVYYVDEKKDVKISYNNKSYPTDILIVCKLNDKFVCTDSIKENIVDNFTIKSLYSEYLNINEEDIIVVENDDKGFE